MSFAGFSFVNKRIFAFTDSAGTKRGVLGSQVRDTEREPLRKLFFNNKLAIVTTGVNELFYEKEGKRTRTDLSSLIDLAIKKATVPENIANGVWNFVQTNKVRLDNDKILIAGVSKRNYGFGEHIIFTLAEIGEKNYKCDNSVIYQKRHCSIGDVNYNSYFDYHPDLIEVDDVEIIKENIKKAISFMNDHLPYNPVGGEIIVQEIILTEIV